MTTYGVRTQQQAVDPNATGVDPVIAGGTYNPMYHQANDQPITMKDLASLYYKSQGQGVVGDNPHPFKAANVYNSAYGTAFSPIQTPEDTRSMLKANIEAAPGGKKDVFNALVQQVQQREATEAHQGADKSILSQTGEKGAGAAAGGGGKTSGLQQAGMENWFNTYITPYMQRKQAEMDFQAQMFDDTVSKILPNMDPDKAQVMAAYFPLISQAYHQQAANFAPKFLTGNDNGSLVKYLVGPQQRNTSIINWLKNSGGGGGGNNSFVAQAIAGL